MSVLEIILYSVLGAVTITYVVVSIIKIKKGKKKKDNDDEE